MKHHTTLDGFLTVEQLAEILRVTRRTIFRWHLKRIGPPRITVGRQTFFKQTSVTE
jgi:excisionase family DNA binding protein